MALVIGNDKTGCPIILCRVRYMDHKNSTQERMRNYGLYSVETAISRMNPGIYQFIFILDFEDTGLANVDLKLFKDMAPIVQCCYPERIYKVYVVNINWLMNMVWKIMKAFMEESTVRKVL